LYRQGNDLHFVLPNYRQAVVSKSTPQTAKDQPLISLGGPLHSLKAINSTRQLTHGLAPELWSPQTPHFFPLKEFANVQSTPSNHQANPSSPSFKTGEPAKQRFKILEELHQEELLTNKEYQHKRQEILKGL